jgi:hypothetical protein
MDREDFEQLVSQWLDQPQDEQLRAAIDAAAVDSPELERLRDEWIRLDQLVRGGADDVERVNWAGFQKRISAELDTAEAGLDARLRDTTAVESRVDWPRLRQRISQAIDEADERSRVIPFPLRRVVMGLACVGAAAVFVAMVVLAPESQTPAAGVAQVQVSQPVAVTPAVESDTGYARVTVSPLPEPPPDDGAESSRSAVAELQVAEVFLMVEPVRVAMGTRGSSNPFGFN